MVNVPKEDSYRNRDVIKEIKEIYPKSFLFSVLINGISKTSKMIKSFKKEGKISEFRYVMD